MNKHSIQKYAVLVKREVWEHRNLIITLPLAFAVLSLLLALLGGAIVSKIGESFNVAEIIAGHEFRISAEQQRETAVVPGDRIIDFESGEVREATEEDRAKASQGTISIQNLDKQAVNFGLDLYLNISLLQFLNFTWFLAAAYLLSSLYADRKDRSVLFWKSLPVSEWENVLVKFGVAVFLMPLIVVPLSWITAVLVGAISAEVLQSLGLVEAAKAINSQATDVSVLGRQFARALPQLGYTLAAGVIMAPLYAWLAVGSALAKRSPFMIAVLPVLVLMIFEFNLLDSYYLFDAIGSHTPFAFTSIFSDEGKLGPNIEAIEVITGLVAAAGLLALAVWLRNRRFEI